MENEESTSHGLMKNGSLSRDDSLTTGCALGANETHLGGRAFTSPITRKQSGMNLSQAMAMVTIQQYMFEQKPCPTFSGELCSLLSDIANATKIIQLLIQRAGLTDILGEHGNVNALGEIQQKLDVYSNEALVRCLSSRECIGLLVSEENERPLLIHRNSRIARYAVVFDPLDGSSNIDAVASVGTTFSILKRPGGVRFDDSELWVLPPGSRQIAAGYVVYGSSTILVCSVGNGVHGFTLDPSVDEYVLSHPNIRMPAQGRYYSVNEAYRDSFPRRYADYIDRLKRGMLGQKYASRYIGSMVADIHRTLLHGGVFLYPPTEEYSNGKLRLLYEANPIAFVVEQAGGMAFDGSRRVLDIQPERIHQRTPLIAGSRVELADFLHSPTAAVSA